MNETIVHRLDGIESDNLLAFLALLGLLRALEAADRDANGEEVVLLPRAAWDLDRPPLRPTLILGRPMTSEEVAENAARGIERLVDVHDFAGEKSLSYTRAQARAILEAEVRSAGVGARERVDLLAALMSDGAIKDEKTEVVEATPFCLMFGQGHQYFLERLADVPNLPVPPPRGKGKAKKVLTAAECLAEALFQTWHRTDPTVSFRWDPEEDVRYALMAGDPTDSAYKTGTQHGANRLAAVGLTALTVVPMKHVWRTRPVAIGGEFRRGFSFAWPVWRQPASLGAIRAMLAHPALRRAGGLDHLGVEHVYVTRRIVVGKYMNFSRGRLLAPEEPVRADEPDSARAAEEALDDAR